MLKFLGDGMLATFPFVDATRDATCSQPSMPQPTRWPVSIGSMPPARRPANQLRRSISRSSREVLYGNVGAVDRLDFTVIGPAVNEAARIETLCEPLGRKVLFRPSWLRWSATAAVSNRLATTLRGARAKKLTSFSALKHERCENARNVASPAASKCGRRRSPNLLRLEVVG